MQTKGYNMRPQCIQSFAHRDIVQIFPVDTWRNENVIVTSKQTFGRCDVIMTLLLRHMPIVLLPYGVETNPITINNMLRKDIFFALSLQDFRA